MPFVVLRIQLFWDVRTTWTVDLELNTGKMMLYCLNSSIILTKATIVIYDPMRMERKL